MQRILKITTLIFILLPVCFLAAENNEQDISQAESLGGGEYMTDSGKIMQLEDLGGGQLMTDDENYLSIVMSREDYASIVGTATESAIRILSQFKKEGIISTRGKRIKIEDYVALKWME